MRLVREHTGFAMIQVLIVMGLIMAMTIVVATQITTSTREAKKRAEWVKHSATAQAGAQLFQRGLTNKTIRSASDFRFTEQKALELAQDADNILVIPNNNVEYFSGAAVNYTDMNTTPTKGGFYYQNTTTTKLVRRNFVSDYTDTNLNEYFTIVNPVAGKPNTKNLWQVARIVAPSNVLTSTGRLHNDGLTVYFRTWSAERACAACPFVHGAISYFRAQFDAPQFSDYQMLTDSNLVFGGGSTIQGMVHSNGLSTTDGLPDPWADGITVRQEAGKTINCGGASGPLISAGDGNVSLTGTGSGCNSLSNTGEFIDFLAASETSNDIQIDAASGASFAKSYTSPSTAYPLQFRVLINDATVEVYDARAGGATLLDSFTTYAGAKRESLGLDFDGPVLIQQTAPLRGKLTLFTKKSITIETNISPNSSPAGDVIGLIAAENVYIDLGETDEYDDGVGTNNSSVTCPVSSVHAAVIAISGSVKLPEVWAGDTPTLNDVIVNGTGDTRSPIVCPSITLTGSVTGHNATMLRWNWNNSVLTSTTVAGVTTLTTQPGIYAGFTNRSYVFDTELLTNPPPYFPFTGEFDMESVALANQDCLNYPRAGIAMDITCK